MASSKQLTRRIKSVSNIAKITKAMEMVSASKMRHAQAQALSSRPYSHKLDEISAKLAMSIDTTHHPLLHTGNPKAPQAVLIISTDRGLTGSLNTNLFKSILSFQQDKQVDFYTVGRLAKEFTLKSGFNLKAEFGEIKDKISYETTIPIRKLLVTEFLKGNYSTIWIAYMDFVSTISQKPLIGQLLPILKQFKPTVNQTQDQQSPKKYLFEPSPQSVFDSLLPYYIELTIYQSLLEARASEHSARMVAMKSASDNATDLTGSLNLQYNRSRQASITSELADIVTASATLS